MGFSPPGFSPPEDCLRARHPALPSRRSIPPSGLSSFQSPFSPREYCIPNRADTLLGFPASVAFGNLVWGGPPMLPSAAHPLMPFLVGPFVLVPTPELQRLPTRPPASFALANAGHSDVLGLRLHRNELRLRRVGLGHATFQQRLRPLLRAATIPKRNPLKSHKPPVQDTVHSLHTPCGNPRPKQTRPQ